MKHFKVSWEELLHLKAVSLPARDSTVISVNSYGKLQGLVCVLKGERTHTKYLGEKPVEGIVYVAWECALTISAQQVKKKIKALI